MSDYETFSFSVQLKTKKEKIELECKDCEEKQYEMKESRAVALIGDRFYHDAFLPAEELENLTLNLGGDSGKKEWWRNAERR